jgi:hypothetical protein
MPTATLYGQEYSKTAVAWASDAQEWMLFAPTGRYGLGSYLRSFASMEDAEAWFANCQRDEAHVMSRLTTESFWLQKINS